MKAGILIGQLSDTRNESALIRSAEGFGINQIFIAGNEKTRLSNTVTRGAHKHMSVHRFNSYKEFCGFAKDHNYSIVSIENTPNSEPIEEGVKYPVNPIFVVGNEGKGVPEDVIEYSDKIVKISQSPNSYIRCLNATVSGSIVIHDWYEQRYNRDKTQKYDLKHNQMPEIK